MIACHRLKQAAGDLGIPLLGVVDAIEMRVPQEALSRRIRKGELSGFEPEVDMVGQPEKVMPGVQSIVVIGLPYELFKSKTEDPEAVCEISSMAWDYDYHDLVRDKLIALGAWLESHGSGECMVFCDTGPLNDRYLAFLAGLGTYGRHQLLINQRYGSAVVFGYLLTRGRIEASSPGLIQPYSECGTCRACQATCPTGALCGEFDFVTSRCISSLTQQKRALSITEASWIGTSLYGCDLCQKVCPKNTVLSDTVLLRSKSPNQLNPFELLNSNKKDFQQKFRHHGFSWRGLKTLQRNAVINIYNSQNSVLIEKLRQWAVERPLPDHLKQVIEMVEGVHIAETPGGFHEYVGGIKAKV
jgi:epoxyqueuosine reductase